MSVNWPKPTYGHVQEYQVSSWPWVTSSNVGTTPVFYSFGAVSRWITIVNEDSGAGNNIIFGFTQNGVAGSNHFHVNPAQVIGPLEVKCAGLWVKSSKVGGVSFSLMAGLTNVSSGDFPVITGSDGFGGVG